MKRPKIVIVGAGFGGMALARKLSKKPVDVILIDKNNYHTFQPLLYQVATGGLEPDSIAYPIRRVFRGSRNVKFRLADVHSVDPKNKSLNTSIGTISYDELVIASGSDTNYFNFETIKAKLFSLKSVNDALDIRSFLMQNMEKAITKLRNEDRDELINVVIVGGGPAGLELAGALAEMRRHVLPKDFPEIDFERMNIYLFEATDKVLGAMSEESSEASLKYLRQLHVRVHLNARVEAFDGKEVTLADGQTFASETVIWTAGVKANPIDGLPAESLGGAQRIKVDEFNRALGTDHIYAIGDVAVHITEENPKGLPMLAPVAMQQGTHVASNLLRSARGEELKPFQFKDKGVMATIGRNKAVVDLPKVKFQGTFAWLVWMFVHLLSLVGFRNKLVTIIDWTQNYFNYDRPLGLIIRKIKK